MAKRLVLRIVREGRLLGSWSLGDEPLEMTMVDVATGRTVARFSASAEALAFVDDVRSTPPPSDGVDEVPVPVMRLSGDDFTMPLPEPTDQAIGDLATEERPRGSRPSPRNLAAAPLPPQDPFPPPDTLPSRDASPSEAGDGLTAELVESEAGDGLTAELVESEAGDGLTSELVESEAGDGLTAELVESEAGDGLTAELRELGQGPVDDPDLEADPVEYLLRPGIDELPVPQDDDPELGLTAELRTATVDMPDRRERKAFGDQDDPSLTAKAPSRSLPLASDEPEPTPRAVLRARRPRAPPQPAEVWAQKQGEWSSLGHLSPGQRVSTLGGWVRLAPDGRLVVHSGASLAGTATLVDGRMIEIDNGDDFLALPPGSSVMLAVGDRGVYVRSEPLPEEGQPAMRLH